MSNDYRLQMSSCGYLMIPIEFLADSDKEAVKKATELLNLQRKSDPEGTASIKYLDRIDMREQTTRIKTN